MCVPNVFSGAGDVMMRVSPDLVSNLLVAMNTSTTAGS